MKTIKPFTTTLGVLFCFQIDKYNSVYATSDINALNVDILDQIGLEGELFIKGKFKWDEFSYEIVNIEGWRYSSLVSDMPPELLSGHIYNHSFSVFITVKKI